MWLRIPLSPKFTPKNRYGWPHKTGSPSSSSEKSRREGKNMKYCRWKLETLYQLFMKSIKLSGIFCCVCCTRRKVIPFSSFWKLELVCTHPRVGRGKSSCAAAFVDVCNVDFECTCLPVIRPRFLHGCIHLELGGHGLNLGIAQFCKTIEFWIQVKSWVKKLFDDIK